MNDDEKWQVEELLARYELEPQLQDVFVEGSFDKEVLERCFAHAGVKGRVVYEIDTVLVPAELLTALGLTSGNKQSVLALASRLATIKVPCAYRCLVDRDLDHWFSELGKTPRLLWTDYCSLELYFFADDMLKDILLTAGTAKIPKWEPFLTSLIGLLQHLYAMRLADRDLDWKLSWITADRCLAVVDHQIAWNASGYIRRLLLKNARAGEIKKFQDKVDLWLAKLVGDVRQSIRGHDLVETLAWTVLKFGGGKNFASSEAVERLLVLLAPRLSGVVELLEPTMLPVTN